MKLSEFKKLIREVAEQEATQSNMTLNEGMLDGLIGYFVDKIIRTKYKGYFDALHNDPEWKSARAELEGLANKMRDRAARYEKDKSKWEKDKRAAEKKFGKKESDRMMGKEFTPYGNYR